MNGTTPESLVVRIEAFLRQPTDALEPGRLAQEYADLCRAANRRLEQCAGLLAVGDVQQAIQLADAPPALLDLVTVLAFREAGTWRAYCQAQGLPVAEALLEKPIRLLNAACGSAEARAHPLYRQVRGALLRNDPEAALAALRAIVSAHPGDTNAQRERLKVENQVLQSRLARLQEVLASGDDTRVLEETRAVEALGLSRPPTGPVWDEAQRVRCRTLVRLLTDGDAGAAASETPPLIEELDRVLRQSGATLPEAEARRVASARARIEGQRQAAADAQGYLAAVSGLQNALDAGVGGRGAVADGPASLADLRRHRDSLIRGMREIERLGRAVPSELAARLEPVLRRLDGQIDRRVRLRRRLVLGSVGAALILLVAAMLHLRSARQGRVWAAELVRLVEQREVAAVESLLREAGPPGGRALRQPPVAAALGRAQAFLDRERRHEEAFTTALTELEAEARRAFEGASPDAVEDRHRRALEEFEGLAPDHRGALRARFLSWQNAWAAHLEAERRRREEQLERQLRLAESMAGRELVYSGGPDPARDALERFEPLVANLVAVTNTRVEALRMPPALQTRLEALAARTARFAAQLADWDRHSPLLRRPSTLEAHLGMLRWLETSEFAEATDAHHAAEMRAVEPSLARLAEALLVPGRTDGARLETFPVGPTPPLVPAQVLPGERAKYSDLRDDETIHNLRLCRVTEVRPGGRDLAAARFVWARGPLSTNRMGRRVGEVFDPRASPAALLFESREYRSFEAHIEDLGWTPEAAAFDRAGLNALMDGNSGRFRAPVLGCLNRLNAETGASPVFRAYVTLRLHELMDLQPWEWGVVWAPALRAHRARLVALGAESLRRGDWLLPAVADPLAARLDEHFREARQVDYLRQARFFHALLTRAWSEGFAFLGFVNPRGERVTPGPEADLQQVWGWRRDTRSPGLLWRRAAGQGRLEAVHEAMPFSPLFVFRGVPDACVRAAAEAAALAPAAPEAAEFLPPLFERVP